MYYKPSDSNRLDGMQYLRACDIDIGQRQTMTGRNTVELNQEQAVAALKTSEWTITASSSTADGMWLNDIFVRQLIVCLQQRH